MMVNQASLKDQILKVVSQHPGCLLDEMVTDCPQHTWNQIFLKVDQMSRNGQIRLSRSENGQYALWLPRVEKVAVNNIEKPKRSEA